ncbi:MAG TPA: glycosyltransferase family 87 protein, partial [Anaerolineaceae bacterium]
LAAVALALFTFAVHSIFLHNTPGFDYFVFWNAGRAFFHGQDPYAPELARQIQMGLYGHLAVPGQNQMLFAYPPYALFILIPVFWMDFGWSQAAWMSANFFLILLAALFLFPKAPRWIRLTIPFFYPFVFGYILGNFVVTITGILLICLHYIFSENSPSPAAQVVLGVLLAWTTAKPQFVWAFLAVTLIYALRQRWWALLASFFSALPVYCLISLAVRPDWISKWLGQIQVYQSTNRAAPYLAGYLQALLPAPLVNPAYDAAVVSCAAVSIYLMVRWWKMGLNPLARFAWLGFFAYLVHPGGEGGVAYEQLVFLIPFFLWAVTLPHTRSLALIWIPALLLSFLKIPAWFEQAYFFLYAIWMAWFFVKTAQTRTRAVPISD